MKCDIVADHIPEIVSGTLTTAVLAECKQHIADCESCSDALRGAQALAELRYRDTGDVPAGLFDRMRSDVTEGSRQAGAGRFWLGSAFGGAVAATIFGLAITLGWIDSDPSAVPEVAEFIVAVDERRVMDLAIESERSLDDARISILLSGGVTLDGYDDRRELTWNTDIRAGVNKLSLPIRAINGQGGRMVVRLSHPDSEQVFLVNVRAGA
jgi:hypothetical protein